MSRALQHVVENCGTAFEPHLTSDLIQLVFTSLSHTNRFVRETGYKVLAAIVMIPGQSRINVCVCVWLLPCLVGWDSFAMMIHAHVRS